MKPLGSHLDRDQTRPVLAALRAAAGPCQPHWNRQDPTPFITISRQAGAGGRSLARQLVARLNEVDPGELPWTVWDNELVEKVAGEHHVPAAMVDSLEDARPSWLQECVAAFAFGDGADHPNEFKVYRRVAVTVRALAEMGRVVVVGRGGALVTRDMPGGVHLRLVAPVWDRVLRTAKATRLSTDEAAAAVREKDRNRELFYRRHWPGHSLVPENFTATFNTAALSGEQLVECVLPLVRTTARRGCNVACAGGSRSCARPAARPETGPPRAGTWRSGAVG